jgi:hypothetical protein
LSTLSEGAWHTNILSENFGKIGKVDVGIIVAIDIGIGGSIDIPVGVFCITSVSIVVNKISDTDVSSTEVSLLEESDFWIKMQLDRKILK